METPTPRLEGKNNGQGWGHRGGGKPIVIFWKDPCSAPNRGSCYSWRRGREGVPLQSCGRAVGEGIGSDGHSLPETRKARKYLEKNELSAGFVNGMDRQGMDVEAADISPTGGEGREKKKS